MKKLFKALLSLTLIFAMCGCSKKDELKNDDYSFKITKMTDVNDNIETEIFLLNKAGEKRENVQVKIYLHILDTDEKVLFYEKEYDVLEDEGIKWDTIVFDNKEIIDQMIVPDEENDSLKNNYEFIYEVYDNK
jgi:hypothetical protein